MSYGEVKEPTSIFLQKHMMRWKIIYLNFWKIILIKEELKLRLY